MRRACGSSRAGQALGERSVEPLGQNDSGGGGGPATKLIYVCKTVHSVLLPPLTCDAAAERSAVSLCQQRPGRVSPNGDGGHFVFDCSTHAKRSSKGALPTTQRPGGPSPTSITKPWWLSAPSSVLVCTCGPRVDAGTARGVNLPTWSSCCKDRWHRPPRSSRAPAPCAICATLPRYHTPPTPRVGSYGVSSPVAKPRSTRKSK